MHRQHCEPNRNYHPKNAIHPLDPHDWSKTIWLVVMVSKYCRKGDSVIHYGKQRLSPQCKRFSDILLCMPRNLIPCEDSKIHVGFCVQDIEHNFRWHGVSWGKITVMQICKLDYSEWTVAIETKALGIVSHFRGRLKHILRRKTHWNHPQWDNKTYCK